MKNRSKLKLVLLIFFLILFALLFWFFYHPSQETEKTKTEKKDNWFVNFFGDEETPTKIEEGSTPTKTKKPKYDWEVELPLLRQISHIPTAGVFFAPLSVQDLHKINVENNVFNTDHAWKVDDRISEIRYIAMRDGYVYSSYTNTLKDKKITNTIIPKVYRADFWDKNNFLIQYLDGEGKDAVIRSYSVRLSEKTDEEILVEQILNENKKIQINKGMLNFNGVFLPAGIQDYSILPNSKFIFYLINKDGRTIGIRSDSFGQEKKQIFVSKLHEWNINWKNQNHILLNLKPSSESYTLFWDLNAKTAYKNKILNPVMAGDGLPNYDFSKIIYSGKKYDGSYLIRVYDLKTKSSKEIKLSTFAEKCVWSKNNIDFYCAVPNDGVNSNEPDAWYMGYTDFSDSIYKINALTGEKELIFDSYTYGKNFDIVKLKLDSYEDYLYFIDSNTNFAWSFKLPEEKKENLVKAEITTEQGQILGGGKLCPANQILHENLKAGDRNGKYSAWAKKKISEVKILQEHMNRLGFSAGPVDGILGKQSDAAIKRMQKYLGTFQDGKVGPITRGLINHSCE